MYKVIQHLFLPNGDVSHACVFSDTEKECKSFLHTEYLEVKQRADKKYSRFPYILFPLDIKCLVNDNFRFIAQKTGEVCIYKIYKDYPEFAEFAVKYTGDDQNIRFRYFYKEGKGLIKK
jgi:hypothetical protein